MGNPGRILKVIDNFREASSNYKGFNQLQSNDVVVIERFKNGQKVFEGVTVDDFIKEDEFLAFGTDDQRFKLVKDKFRNSVDISVLEYKRKNEERFCYLSRGDSLIVEKIEKPFSDRPERTTIELSVKSFVEGPGFSFLGSSEDRLDFLKEAFFNTCRDEYGYFVEREIFPFENSLFEWKKDNSANTSDINYINIEQRLESYVARAEEHDRIQRHLIPTKASLVISKETVLAFGTSDHNYLEKTFTIIKIKFSGEDQVSIRFELDQNTGEVSLAPISTEPPVEGVSSQVLLHNEPTTMDVSMLQNWGLDLENLNRGIKEATEKKPKEIELPPALTAYFWTLVQDRL